MAVGGGGCATDCRLVGDRAAHATVAQRSTQRSCRGRGACLLGGRGVVGLTIFVYLSRATDVIMYYVKLCEAGGDGRALMRRAADVPSVSVRCVYMWLARFRAVPGRFQRSRPPRGIADSDTGLLVISSGPPQRTSHGPWAWHMGSGHTIRDKRSSKAR